MNTGVKPLIFSIALLFAASVQAQDTLTIKDCHCSEYDSAYKICSVTIFSGQVFRHDKGYVLHEMLSPWEFTKKNQVEYRTPYGSQTATWSGLTSNLRVCYCTLIFFIKKEMRA